MNGALRADYGRPRRRFQMRTPILVVILLLVSLSTKFAAAHSVGFESIKFTYSGVDINGFGAISSGVGIFVFPIGLKTITLSDLVGFQFFQTTTLLGDNPVSSTFFYTLTSLTDFSAVITGTVFTSSLSLNTTETTGSNPVFAPESFHIISLTPQGAFTATGGTTLTQGTAQLVPEPASIVLIATGLLGIASRTRKGRPPAK